MNESSQHFLVGSKGVQKLQRLLPGRIAVNQSFIQRLAIEVASSGREYLAGNEAESQEGVDVEDCVERFISWDTLRLQSF